MLGAFSEAVVIAKLDCKIFFKDKKISWTAKFSHCTKLTLRLVLPAKQNQQTSFVFKIG